jgi:hypothetical protein
MKFFNAESLLKQITGLEKFSNAVWMNAAATAGQKKAGLLCPAFSLETSLHQFVA